MALCWRSLNRSYGMLVRFRMLFELLCRVKVITTDRDN